MVPIPMSDVSHDSLVILIHAFMLNPNSMRHVKRAVGELKQNAHVVAPRLPLGMFSTADANVLAREVLEEIERQINRAGPCRTRRSFC
jgi:hypothetical protein